MEVESCLILSAGLGTRMGEIGKVLPKPLWPMDGTTMLGKQIQFVESLGIKDIWVNVHHNRDMVIDYLRRFYPHVNILVEDDILGPGGAVHNLAREIGYSGKVLTINSDVFYSLDQLLVDRLLKEKLKVSSRLLLYEVKESLDYNEVIVRDGAVVGIEKSKRTPFFTYAGIGVIDLSCLDEVPGKSSFFESVCDFKNHRVEVLSEKNLDFVDFGTLEKYVKNYRKDTKGSIRSEIGEISLEFEGDLVKVRYMDLVDIVTFDQCFEGKSS